MTQTPIYKDPRIEDQSDNFTPTTTLHTETSLLEAELREARENVTRLKGKLERALLAGVTLYAADNESEARIAQLEAVEVGLRCRIDSAKLAIMKLIEAAQNQLEGASIAISTAHDSQEQIQGVFGKVKAEAEIAAYQEALRLLEGK